MENKPQERKFGHAFQLRHEDDSPVIDRETGMIQMGWCDDPNCPRNKPPYTSGK